MDPRIEALHRHAAASPDVIVLSGGLPATAQFPRADLARSFLHVVSQPRAGALQYGWPEGAAPLRAWIAARLRARGADVGPGDVIVTSGAQQAVAIAAQLTARPGERIGVDRESYPAALDLFRGAGLSLTAFGDAPVRYAMPQLSNPRGVRLGEAGRRRLLARARVIIEDDAYAEVRWDGDPGRPLVADARARVWHVGTFSKTLCPGLRVGWLVPPPDRLDDAIAHKRDLDLHASSLGQEVLAHYVARTDWDARLHRLQRFYANRCERLAEAVARHLPTFRIVAPEGGFTIWVESDDPIDDVALLTTAVAHGVSVDPGRMFRPRQTGHPLALRLCFSTEPGYRLVEGVRRLARARDALVRERGRLGADAFRGPRERGRRLPPRVRALRA